MIYVILAILLLMCLLILRSTRAQKAPMSGSVLDTSALIDGRLPKMIDQELIVLPLLIPSQVIRELDEFIHSDHSKYDFQREASMRAMIFLKQQKAVEHDDQYGELDADEQVVLLAIKHSYNVVSLDNEVVLSAKEKGLLVVNADHVFDAVRPCLYKGQTVRVKLMYRADKTKRVIGLTDHGEVVLIPGVVSLIGKSIDVEVTAVTRSGRSRLVEAVSR